MNRRAFLRASLAGLAALLAAGCDDAGGGTEEAPPLDPTDASDVLAALPATALPLSAIVDGFFEGVEPDAARAIGAVYVGDVGDLDALREALSLTVGRVAALETPEDAAERLFAAVIADFEALEQIPVAGWHLARTEVHLCALAWLLDAAA